MPRASPAHVQVPEIDPNPPVGTFRFQVAISGSKKPRPYRLNRSRLLPTRPGSQTQRKIDAVSVSEKSGVGRNRPPVLAGSSQLLYV